MSIVCKLARSAYSLMEIGHMAVRQTWFDMIMLDMLELCKAQYRNTCMSKCDFCPK